MWNSLDLQCPTDDLVPYPPQEHYLAEELRDFVTVLTAAADTLTFENPLWEELKVLNNIQAKYKRILRCDRCLIFLNRVGHCIKKMVLLNLSKSCLDLAERFLSGFQDSPGLFGTFQLPSRQQAEYVLIRTLSASKLVCEAISYSRESFCYLIQKLKVGHLILDLIMATSVIARLNILMRATLEKLCSMYKQVLFWRYKIKKGQHEWGEKFDFPQDVEEWIKTFEPACLEHLSMTNEDIDRVKSILNHAYDNSEKNEESEPESVILLNEIEKDTDYGEVIPREKVKMNGKSSQNKKNDSNVHLTKMQNLMLQKIRKIKSLKNLEILWHKIKNSSKDYLPKALTKKKKRTVDKLFTKIKAACTDNMINNTFKKRPSFLKKTVLLFCQHLGFTEDFIKNCNKASVLDSSNEVRILNISKPLEPVKTLKELKILYKQLTEMLKLKNEIEKSRALKEVFQLGLCNIRHFRKEKKMDMAKKLTWLTSKKILSLCK